MLLSTSQRPRRGQNPVRSYLRVNHMLGLWPHNDPEAKTGNGGIPTMTFRRKILTAALLCAPLPALAEPSVALDSAVYVEHTRQQGTAQIRALEPAQRVARGDRVVTLVSWYKLGGSGGFTVVNAVPAGLAYQQSAEGDEEVSVDGGKRWGQLAALRVGTRHATAEDVTHLRWRVTPSQAMIGAGRIAYSGFVR